MVVLEVHYHFVCYHYYIYFGLSKTLVLVPIMIFPFNTHCYHASSNFVEEKGTSAGGLQIVTQQPEKLLRMLAL